MLWLYYGMHVCPNFVGCLNACTAACVEEWSRLQPESLLTRRHSCLLAMSECRVLCPVMFLSRANSAAIRHKALRHGDNTEFYECCILTVWHISTKFQHCFSCSSLSFSCGEKLRLECIVDFLLIYLFLYILLNRAWDTQEPEW